MGEIIKELGPGKELDYLYVLRSLNEIQFSVGKGLLVDFLKGNMKNVSIKKNELWQLSNFSSLYKYSEAEISSIIENLIVNSMIELNSLIGNKFAKVISITSKGKEELINPSLFKKKIKQEQNFIKTKITDEERILFKELDFFLGEYNDEQKKAIILQNPQILCIAGAGSGKTSVLVKRIEFLVKFQSKDPKKILAITFTRKAKQEMEHRLKNLGINEVQVETFNSFSEGILQKYGNLIYSSPKRVMSFQDKIVAINFALSDMGLDINTVANNYFSENQKKNKEIRNLNNIFMNDCFSVLEYFKSKNQPLYDFSNDLKDEKEIEIAKIISRVCENIEKHMSSHGLRDYIDQILDTINLFKKNKEVIPKFENILIDEYQDINAMQIELIDILMENDKNIGLFAVGDPRQSIFGWRGSDIKYIIDFNKKYPQCETINLIKNYRSNKKIVDFMNFSIKDMKLLDLETHNFEDSEIKLLDFDSEEKEQHFVINEIKNFMNDGIPGDEIFILARTNRQLNDFSNKLKNEKINHVLKTDEIKKPTIANKGDITLATIHAIKGLEAKVVFIIGCNEQNFPCKASDHPVIEMVKSDMQEYDKEEEERRLFYVAISRAKEKLFLTYSGKKPTYFINEQMARLVRD